MIFGDRKIKRLILNPGRLEFGRDEMVNPASVNLRLGHNFLIPVKTPAGITLGQRVPYKRVDVKDEPFALEAGRFCLATTMEGIFMPDNVAAFVQGRSSIGRIGLTVQNAGFIDPGFEGHITLELVNDSPNTIYLVPEYPVAQLVFFQCSRVDHLYQGKYNGQVDATGSRMIEDRDKYPNLRYISPYEAATAQGEEFVRADNKGADAPEKGEQA